MLIFTEQRSLEFKTSDWIKFTKASTFCGFVSINQAFIMLSRCSAVYLSLISFEFNISSMTSKPSITELTSSDRLTRKGTVMAQLFFTSTPDISLNSSSIQLEYGMSVPFAAFNSISTPCPTSSSIFVSLIPGNCSATHRSGSAETWAPVSQRASVSNSFNLQFMVAYCPFSELLGTLLA